MPMRSRTPVLLALVLALCALPGVRAFASAMPCCAESGETAPGPDCAAQDSDCCQLVPAAPAAPAEQVKAQPAAPAIVSALHGITPVPAALLALQPTSQIAAAISASRLSVVRLL
jgi:hypothetical protein